MGILEAVIMALIYIALIALAVYLVIWVLGIIGLAIPEKVVQILWVIVVLVAILVIIRVFVPSLGKLALIDSAYAAQRKQVYINKPSPPIDASGNVPLVAVPPAAVAFDLIRRTSCDPRIAVSTGKGDPGFDLVNGPKTGNFLIPAINRKDSYCYKPK